MASPKRAASAPTGNTIILAPISIRASLAVTGGACSGILLREIGLGRHIEYWPHMNPEEQRSIDSLTESVLGAVFEVSNTLGAGFLKKVYERALDRKSTRLNSSHRCISYAVFCLKKKQHLLISPRRHRGPEHSPASLGGPRHR